MLLGMRSQKINGRSMIGCLGGVEVANPRFFKVIYVKPQNKESLHRIAKVLVR